MFSRRTNIVGLTAGGLLTAISTATLFAEDCPVDGTTHFWLSPLAAESPFGEVPLINVSDGSTVYIWGRPEGRQTIRDLSLDLNSTPSTAIQFVSAAVDNPNLDKSGDKPAFRYEHTPPPTRITSDRVTSIQGFTVAETERLGQGFGLANSDNDAFYSELTNTWRVGAVGFTVGSAGAETSSLFLQIGINGINGVNSSGESTPVFDVVFGDPNDEALCTIDHRRQNSAGHDAQIAGGLVSPDGLELVQGTYWQGDGATLLLNIDGPSPIDEHDQLHAVGLSHLDGGLALDVNNNGGAYLDPPARGGLDSFVLLHADIVEGTFETVVYDGVELTDDFSDLSGTEKSFRSHQGEGLFRIVAYESDRVIFHNYRALMGDIDGDFTVGFRDFLILSNRFGQTGSWIDGNFGQDNLVQFDDFLQLSSSFGMTLLPRVARASPVPEPGPLGGLVLCGLLAAAFRRPKTPRPTM